MIDLTLSPNMRLLNVQAVELKSDLNNNAEEAQKPSLKEGYKYYQHDSHNVARININNNRLWDVLTSFKDILPSTMVLMMNHIEEENEIDSTNYHDTDDIFQQLEAFKTELTQDGYLGWMLMNDSESITELQVLYTKELIYLSSDYTAFEKKMEQLGISYFADLNFLSQYPHINEPLNHHKDWVRDTDDTIIEIMQTFDFLSGN